jgi:ribulose-phosphate 3-epimerase
MRSLRLAPSILAADFANLAHEIAAAERGGADLIHVDVMDGHFVPNITIGPPVVKSIRRVTNIPLDVHLMIEDPDRYLDDFAQAGANYISVHVEVVPHLHRTISEIKRLGLKAGAVLNPSTPVVSLENVAGDVDYVLVMSVNPGFGAQSFIPRSIAKIRDVRALLDRAGNAAPVEVDGGIDRRTIGSVVSAGADMLVAGNAVFGTPDPAQAVRDLRAAALAALAIPS